MQYKNVGLCNIQVLTVMMIKDPGGKLNEFDLATSHSGGLAREQSTDIAGGRCQQAFSDEPTDDR